MRRLRLRLARAFARRRAAAPPSFAAVLGRAIGDEEPLTLRLATLARTLPAAPAGAARRPRPRAAALLASHPVSGAALAARTPKE